MYPAHALTDNPWLVALLLLSLLADVVAFRPGGLLSLQVGWLRDTRSVRTFGRLSGLYLLAIPVLLVQLFALSGLGLFCFRHADAPLLLAAPTLDEALGLLLCVAAPAAWFLAQWGAFNWAGYLMGEAERIVILNRIYMAAHLLAAPVALLLFLVAILVPTSGLTVLFLFIGLFILVQGVFIYNGFKIFCDGIWSFCFIFLYLCALEIAPLAVLTAKLT